MALYASVGPELAWYGVDLERFELARLGSVTLPGNVQEGWPHPSKQLLYVAWSNGGPSFGAPGSGQAPAGDSHGITTFRVDPASGALTPHGEWAPLPSRPIHMTVDIPGAHVLTAYNNPSGITVHRVQPDGTAGPEVKPPAPLDTGVYAHQVRVAPSNDSVILVTRGNGPTDAKPEDPGALKHFGYRDGLLTDRASIAPGGGFGFQPRHLDFDPLGPWVFLSLERQNKLQVYERLTGETLSSEPRFTKETLEAPATGGHGQALGTVHVHPGGQVVYVANRASGTRDFQGTRVFAGGENSIAVFRIDHERGEPALVQSIDSGGIHPRTFAVDPGGRILVAANQMSLPVRDGATVRPVPAGLSVFRVSGDGRLAFARKYDIETGPGRSLFWMGMAALPW